VGQSRRINYLLSDIKQGKESYASSVARVAGSPVTADKLTTLLTTSLLNSAIAYLKSLISSRRITLIAIFN